MYFLHFFENNFCAFKAFFTFLDHMGPISHWLVGGLPHVKTLNCVG